MEMKWGILGEPALRGCVREPVEGPAPQLRVGVAVAG